jgi:hypothetical protein
VTAPSQRWSAGRTRWVSPGELVDPRQLAVDVIDRTTGRRFVEAHHYSASYVASRLEVGLFQGTDLVGVAAFSVGAQPAALPRWTGQPAAEGVELGRFVLLDGVAFNAETWFLARAFRLLRAELPEVRAVLSYSDPEPRTDGAGRLVFPGHVGTIYQAFNGRYLGRNKGRTLWLDPYGRAVSPRTLSKVRLGERGAAAAYETLVALGAPRLREGEQPAAWVTRALAEGPFRPFRHAGNHVYAWALDGADECLAPAQPRPRKGREAQPALWSAA